MAIPSVRCGCWWPSPGGDAIAAACSRQARRVLGIIVVDNRRPPQHREDLLLSRAAGTRCSSHLCHRDQQSLHEPTFELAARLRAISVSPESPNRWSRTRAPATMWRAPRAGPWQAGGMNYRRPAPAPRQPPRASVQAAPMRYRPHPLQGDRASLTAVIAAKCLHFANVSPILGHVKAAVCALSRSRTEALDLMPEVPTMNEAGSGFGGAGVVRAARARSDPRKSLPPWGMQLPSRAFARSASASPIMRRSCVQLAR